MEPTKIRLRIQSDMVNAMRAKDSERLGTIRLLMSAIKQTEIDKRTDGERNELDETQILAVIEKLVKQRRESIELYKTGNREDLVKKEEAEIKVLQDYLPEQLSETEIEKLITQAIKESGATAMKDMGKVMAILQVSLQGRADIAKVSAQVKSLLS